jgi:tRNA threonylcarbamoyladenosine biosynthesis protein TsaB
MTILALETSTQRGSLAVLTGDKVHLAEQFSAKRGHSSGFFSALSRARQKTPGFDAVVVGLGPGSYSGVRIAIAAAIGLELTFHSELLGIPSFLALDIDNDSYQVIGDARRNSFYYALVEKEQCADGPLLLDIKALKQRLAQHGSVPIFSWDEFPTLPKAQITFPSAVRLAHLAQRQIGIVARGNLEPIYLRPPHITRARR